MPFRGKRKKSTGLATGKCSRWKASGRVHISKKRQAEKAAKATTIEAQLRAEQKAHRATKKDLHKHKEICEHQHVDLGPIHLLRKTFFELSAAQRKTRVEQLQGFFRMAQAKLLMLTGKESKVTDRYWADCFPLHDEEKKLSDFNPDLEDESLREPEIVDPVGDYNNDNSLHLSDVWRKLFRLRGIADEEGSVSSASLRKIFMATEIADLTGGRLCDLKKCMDEAIQARIKFHEVEIDGEPAGVWLEPADVIREMLQVAGIDPKDNQKYKINLMGDGRCFGDARNTTFYALRIVYLDGYRSTSNEAIWPLAIFECPEKRAILRKLTQNMRKALNHVQQRGVYLSHTYAAVFYSDDEQVLQFANLSPPPIFAQKSPIFNAQKWPPKIHLRK